MDYPYDDVHEFIVQRGENYKVFGAWKVYTNVEQALATFDAYRACTQYLTFVYQQGCSLATTCPGNPIEHTSRGRTPHNRKDVNMSKIAVVYWSGTGNTEAMANFVAEGATGAGAEAEVIPCADFSADKAAEL